MNPPSAFILAGTHSGCGKTTVTLGMMAALAAQGHVVQPFKVGPDFIDPGHHTRVTGRVSHNLDGWMMDREWNQALFARMAGKADVLVGEGVMGLYDGFSGTDEAGSTAQMAKWLGIPVLLVVDARSMARSAAAMVYGYASFDPDLHIAGVLFNRVGSPAHARMLTEALAAAGGPPCFGCLPREELLTMPSRHLGLVTAEDTSQSARPGEVFGQWVETYVSLQDVLEKTRITVATAESMPEGSAGRARRAPDVRIGLARDEAFCFYYPENLRLLEQAGAELVPFSPIRDQRLPQELDGLYLGGGYPELHAASLAGNSELRNEIVWFANQGGPIYAECGGFMYCMHSLMDLQGEVHPMLGLFPMQARMDTRLRALGYREVHLNRQTLLGSAGTVIRGHEFHYSSINNMSPEVECVYTLRDRKGNMDRREGASVLNVLASYVHLHFGSCPRAAEDLVAFCRRVKARDQIA